MIDTCFLVDLMSARKAPRNQEEEMDWLRGGVVDPPPAWWEMDLWLKQQAICEGVSALRVRWLEQYGLYRVEYQPDIAFENEEHPHLMDPNGLMRFTINEIPDLLLRFRRECGPGAQIYCGDIACPKEEVSS